MGMTGTSVGLLVAAAIGCGLGWLVGSRRHPAYVLGFSLLLLGVAGVVVATLPSVLMGVAAAGDEPWAIVAGQIWMNRIIGMMITAGATFALVAGARALWSSPRRLPPRETAAPRSSRSSTH